VTDLQGLSVFDRSRDRVVKRSRPIREMSDLQGFFSRLERLFCIQAVIDVGNHDLPANSPVSTRWTRVVDVCVPQVQALKAVKCLKSPPTARAARAVAPVPAW